MGEGREGCPRLKRRRAALIVLGGSLLVIGLLRTANVIFAGIFFINLSPSIPVGLYMRQGGKALEVGDTVVLKVSEKVRVVAIKIGLLQHTKLLFKRIQAGPGERFCFEGGVLRVRKGEFGLKRETSTGMVLPQLKGCSVLSPSEYLVVGDTADSFDSRYFGAVREEDVVARVRPVVTF